VSGSISYSTLSPSAVVSHIWREYKVGELTGAEFLARGLNDTFRVRAGDRTYGFRVYRAGWRSRSETEYELEILLHLDRKGIAVSKPIGSRDGSLLYPIEQPEGPLCCTVHMREFAAKVRHRIEAVQPQLNFGFCHGDLHGGNAAFDGDTITMFDFDCCGVGWRAYDIAVYRWLLDMRSTTSNWKPFLDAY